MFNLNTLVRPNIRDLVPYSSARDEFKGRADVFLDANENSLGSPLLKWYNRYPDPLAMKVKEKIAGIKGLPPAQIFWVTAVMKPSISSTAFSVSRGWIT